MQIKKRGDLIVDQYGNYYYAIDQKENTLLLVNAFMDLTFRRKLDDIYFEENEGDYIGDRPMYLLKGNLDMIINKKSKLQIYPLEEVEKHYDVIIETLYQR
ncbi:hypothetical protein EV207_12826 [Scopulibacillus darangshiensis]|uniref:Uncharacterized protein n=1 Tax=Scopulibacillus darangshiensis TaxID=442528 RepID=A0A4R2NPQ4_9BACL|nr:hypothetical protein [Scopulibacillus darangshiensis]TCP23803.1 hypothetical protein EV207_12826 [Scopulibacillus darangshiensis]